MDAQVRELIIQCFMADADFRAKAEAVQDVGDISVYELLDLDAVRDACLDVCGIPADNWTTCVGEPRPDEFCRDWYMEAIFAIKSKAEASAAVDEFCRIGQSIRDAGGVARYQKGDE